MYHKCFSCTLQIQLVSWHGIVITNDFGIHVFLKSNIQLFINFATTNIQTLILYFRN